MEKNEKKMKKESKIRISIFIFIIYNTLCTQNLKTLAPIGAEVHFRSNIYKLLKCCVDGENCVCCYSHWFCLLCLALVL